MSLTSMSKEVKARVARDDSTPLFILNLARRRGRSHIAPESAGSGYTSPDMRFQRDDEAESAWSSLPAELLQSIMQRVEAAEATWPGRRDVVACASVCKTWREATKEVVQSPEQCGYLTFPFSLKQPGPRDAPIQCFIKRDRATLTYRLYLGLSPALSDDMSKLLLAAKKIRRAASTQFRIFLSGKRSYQTSSNSVGKLRSNFLRTKFSVHDTLLLSSQGDTLYGSKSIEKCNYSVDFSSSNPARPQRVASISYELNIFRTRGPRRMNCVMNSIPLSSIGGGMEYTPVTFLNCDEEMPNTSVLCRMNHQESGLSSSCPSPAPFRESFLSNKEPLILKNKTPRWHEQLQCWCLNFKGRVTVASVKNFQLVASVSNGHILPVEEQEKVILQFGKIGKDIFTMDYRYPLSAFQAFAICLSSFDTKPACE